MKRILKYSALLAVLCIFIDVVFAQAQVKTAPKLLRVGYSVQIQNITPAKMIYAKAAGIQTLEVTLSNITNKDCTLKLSDEAIIDSMKKAKKAADDAGIQIYSVHMPYGEHIDISLGNEAERQKVMALHKKLLGFCKIFQPKIILFHPSWYLGLNERELRKKQMIKSAIALNAIVKAMGAQMVIENMLGPKLLRDSTHERPLCRTVAETVEIMNRLPNDIYSAIDLNHMKNPENLILAMGARLKTLHVADGNGLEEDHYFPCSGKGKNDWVKILAALNTVHYSGPFNYECSFPDVKDLKPCYMSMYHNFVNSLTANTR